MKLLQSFSANDSRRRVQMPTGKTRKTHACLRLELVEDRLMCAADVSTAAPTATTIRSIDGAGNNLQNPAWGSAGTDLLRLAAASYSDGFNSPAGANLPSARAISNAIDAHDNGDVKNDRSLSAFAYAWGQFIDHDIDLTTAASPAVAFNVKVPTGDAAFDPLSTGTQVIPLHRSNADPKTGTSASKPRQQINDITSYIDGSMIYGSDNVRAAALRTFSGGLMATSAGNLLPLNTKGLPNANDAHTTPDNQLFLAGDVRANENVELTSIQTLFVREHNRLAGKIAVANPKLTDEQIFQQARAMVIAEIQSITYNEFLPALLGKNAITDYKGYNPAVNPGIANEFSTAAFRFGHSMVGNDVEFLDNIGANVHDAMSFADVFFAPNVVKQTGIDPILKYLASDLAEEVDTQVVDSLRNFLFGPPGSGGLDLVSLNIQRGRDHGLNDYNDTRAAIGLPRVKSFADITSDVALQQHLKSVYGNVNDIDLWVGGLAEDHVKGGSLGQTFTKIIADQFQRLRDGDRFYFERTFSGSQLAQIEDTTLADVIRNNTGDWNLQDNVFFFRASIGGRVTAFSLDRRDVGLAGREIQLLDSTGAILLTTKTAADGTYHFDGLALGVYQVREVTAVGTVVTTPKSQSIQITRGMLATNINFTELLPIKCMPMRLTAIADTILNGGIGQLS